MDSIWGYFKRPWDHCYDHVSLTSWANKNVQVSDSWCRIVAWSTSLVGRLSRNQKKQSEIKHCNHTAKACPSSISTNYVPSWNRALGSNCDVCYWRISPWWVVSGVKVCGIAFPSYNWDNPMRGFIKQGFSTLALFGIFPTSLSLPVPRFLDPSASAQTCQRERAWAP